MIPRAPRAQISPDFVRKVHACGKPRVVLAALSGWPAQNHLSEDLTARRVKVTPLLIERLTKLASAVDYHGPLFKVPK